MKAIVVFHDGYVKLEYQHNGTRTRKSTGVSIPNKTYLKSNRELKSTVENYNEKQKTVDAFLTKAKTILDDYIYEYKVYPTGEQFKRQWDEHDRRIKDSKLLMDFYNRFIESKETEFSRVGFNDNSIKDYRNIRFYLEDYVTETKKDIFLDDVNRDWLNRFVLFLETERKDYTKSRKVGGKYWSKGKLNPNTIKKRISLFIGFFTWLNNESYFPFPKSLHKYTKSLDDSDAIKDALTKEEVNRLYHFDFEDEKYNYIKDVFVLSCFTGMRWDDITTFNYKDVHKNGAFRIIEKKAHKTKDIFRVPINSIVEDIISKHKYNFYKYENANFNKYLKVLLEKTGWFNDETKFIEDGKYLKRWECISIHRGRDSFCTMLINDRVPLNEIMKYTGHKHLSSLNKYINLKSDISNFTNELVIHE
jgi:site-specific recombinase XerD